MVGIKRTEKKNKKLMKNRHKGRSAITKGTEHLWTKKGTS